MALLDYIRLLIREKYLLSWPAHMRLASALKFADTSEFASSTIRNLRELLYDCGCPRVLVLVNNDEHRRAQLANRLLDLLGEQLLPVVNGLPMNFNPLRLAYIEHPKVSELNELPRIRLGRIMQEASPVAPFNEYLSELTDHEQILLSNHFGAQKAAGQEDIQVDFPLIRDVAIQRTTAAEVNGDKVDEAVRNSNGGVLFVENGLQCQRPMMSTLLEAAANWGNIDGNPVRRHGLVIFTATADDVQTTLDADWGPPVLERCVLVNV